MFEVGEGQAGATITSAIAADLVHAATVPDAGHVERVIGLARP
jgi:hypothetical protein